MQLDAVLIYAKGGSGIRAGLYTDYSFALWKDGELIKLHIAPEMMRESKEILEDLIIAAHGDAKQKVKMKASEELSKITGGVPLPSGFKWPF